MPRRLIVVGLVFLSCFMYVYGFYKQDGTQALELLQNPGQLAAAEEKSGRTVDAALLGDMARTDIQSYLLYRLWSVGNYDYAYGATYFEALSLDSEVDLAEPTGWQGESRYGGAPRAIGL